MKRSENKKIETPKFKDTSRFTRWINEFDDRDGQLSPLKRKSKWLLVLGSFLLIFILSFILFPKAELKHEKPAPPIRQMPSAGASSATNSFSMPVDSFEQLLKSRIHENVSEK